MSEPRENPADQTAAFQKIWGESLSRLMQAACTFAPGSAPPELLRQLRTQMLQALADSWNEFLRSPEFQQGMKQWMDSAIALRQVTRDAFTRVHKELQSPSREDIDAVMLAVRRVETRLLDRIEELSKQISGVNGALSKQAGKTARKSRSASPSRRRRASR